MPTRIFFVLLILLVFCEPVLSQTVKVRKETMTIKGVEMNGYGVDLDGTVADINAAFLKFLKPIGKVRQGEYITIPEASIDGLTVPLVMGTIRGTGNSGMAWLGFDADQKNDADKIMKSLESLMKDFGVKFYRDKIQVQIDESEKARQTVERTKQRLLNENKSLNTKLENNKKEKVNLEKALEDNKLEHETLLRKLEENKKVQDSIAVAAEQIRKVVEMHKQRQGEVN